MMLLMLVAGLLATGCSASLVPFTHDLRTEHNLSEDDVRALQFYVSSDVKLRREVRTKGRVIEDGHLKLRAGKSVEEIVVAEHTPGVVVDIDDATIRISFQHGSALNFSLHTGVPKPLVKEPPSLTGFAEPPDAFPGERGDGPVIFVDNDLGNYWLDGDDDGLIRFQGKAWEAVEQTFRAHLMIDAESLEDVVESETTLDGLRLGQRRLPMLRF